MDGWVEGQSVQTQNVYLFFKVTRHTSITLERDYSYQKVGHHKTRLGSDMVCLVTILGSVPKNIYQNLTYQKNELVIFPNKVYKFPYLQM